MRLGLKNQFTLVKTIDFSLLVPQKLSVDSSINDNVYQKKVSKDLVPILCKVIGLKLRLKIPFKNKAIKKFEQFV